MGIVIELKLDQNNLAQLVNLMIQCYGKTVKNNFYIQKTPIPQIRRLGVFVV